MNATNSVHLQETEESEDYSDLMHAVAKPYSVVMSSPSIHTPHTSCKQIPSPSLGTAEGVRVYSWNVGEVSWIFDIGYWIRTFFSPNLSGIA